MILIISPSSVDQTAIVLILFTINDRGPVSFFLISQRTIMILIISPSSVDQTVTESVQ